MTNSSVVIKLSDRLRITYEKEYSQYLLLSIAAAFCNLFFYQNYIMSFCYVMCELAILTILFIKKRYDAYICCFLIFMSTSLEYPYYYGNEQIFGFKGMRIAGITVGSVCLWPVFFIALINIKKAWKSKKQFFYLQKLVRLIIFMVLCAAITGLFQILFNDNEIGDFKGVWKTYCIGLYSLITLVLMPVYTFYYFCTSDKQMLKKIVKTLIAIMVSIILAQIVSFLTGFMGTSWKSPVLIVSLVAAFTPYIMLLHFYKKQLNLKNAWLYLVIGIVGSLLSFRFTFGSGNLLVLLALPVFIAILSAKKGYLKEMILFFSVLLMLGIAAYFLLKDNFSMSILLEYKLQQVLAALKFWQDDWLTSMPASPKVRIIEFYNICMEYMHKPYNLILGKGIVGGFRDYSQWYHTANFFGSESAYTAFEWMTSNFFSVHESINVLFLSNGLVGLYSIGYVIIVCLKKITTSPFIIIGLLWFLFYYGYSTTLSMFGIMCLVVGFAYADKKGEL